MNDNGDWERDAKAYLSSGFLPNHTWFIHPSTSAEAEVNGGTLRQIRADQEQQLREFFTLNRDLVERIVAKLKTVDAIETDQICEFLKQAATVSE